MPLQLTERAAQEVKAILAQRDASPEATWLRLGARSGGCCGLSYALNFDDARADGDHEFESHGIRILCDADSYPLVDGTTLDFDQRSPEGSFVVNNPRATDTCACGGSFSA